MGNSTQTKETELEQWFNDLVAEFRSHQLQLESDIANAELSHIYQTLMKGNTNEIAHMNKIYVQKHFVSAIIVEYLNLIKNNFPLKLAFDFDDAEVLVWAEIEDGNEAQEKQLILAEAKVNSIYHPFGYDLSSTIVEKSDNLAVPNHYQLFK